MNKMVRGLFLVVLVGLVSTVQPMSLLKSIKDKINENMSTVYTNQNGTVVCTFYSGVTFIINTTVKITINNQSHYIDDPELTQKLQNFCKDHVRKINKKTTTLSSSLASSSEGTVPSLDVFAKNVLRMNEIKTEMAKIKNSLGVIENKVPELDGAEDVFKAAKLNFKAVTAELEEFVEKNPKVLKDDLRQTELRRKYNNAAKKYAGAIRRKNLLDRKNALKLENDQLSEEMGDCEQILEDLDQKLEEEAKEEISNALAVPIDEDVDDVGVKEDLEKIEKEIEEEAIEADFKKLEQEIKEEDSKKKEDSKKTVEEKMLEELEN